MGRWQLKLARCHKISSFFAGFPKVLRYCNNLFSRFGAVSKVEIKTKKDIDGNVAQTFAFIDLKCGEDGVSQYISTIANKK